MFSERQKGERGQIEQQVLSKQEESGEKTAAKPEEVSDDFDSLRKEIKELKEEELLKKSRNEDYDPHFDNIDPDSLTEKNLEIYKKFKEHTLSKQDFDNQRNEVSAKGIDDPRQNFYAWLANELTKKENIKWFDPEEYERHKEIYGLMG